MVIRWLGAFRTQGTLFDALVWELTQTTKKHVAAEKLQRGKSYITHAKIGLLIKNSAVVKRYRSDVWSEYTRIGTLKKTRREGDAWSRHTEVWARPVYLGIVLKSFKLSSTAWQAVDEISKNFNLQVFYLNPADRKLHKVTIFRNERRKWKAIFEN